MSSRWPLQEASPCLSVVMSHCWTISLASTSRPPSTSLVWPSREFLCKPDPPSSAPRPSPSSRHLLFAHQPSRVKMMGQFKKKSYVFSLFPPIFCDQFFISDIRAGLQTSNKPSAYPVRMENSVPLVPQNQSSQSLHIQPSMLAQVGSYKCLNY